MIKVGVIGCGFMGGMHTASYAALAQSMDVKVVAVADVRPEFAKKVAAVVGEDVSIYNCGMDLIENADVDMVDICLPTHLHVAHAVAAMKKGLNVFVEKPVCFKDEEMELLLQTEKETGVKAQVGQSVRHGLPTKWLKKAIESGEYGKVVHAQLRRLSARPTWAWENWLHQVDKSGSVALDMHVHDVDMVRYLIGNPDTIQSQAYRDEDGAIQHITSLYGYGKDVMVSLEGGWNYPSCFPFTSDIRIMFEKATVTVARGVLTVYKNDGTVETPELIPEYTGTNNIGGNVSSLGNYYMELKYFIEGLQGKNDLSIARIEDAIESVRLAKKEIEAAGGLIVK